MTNDAWIALTFCLFFPLPFFLLPFFSFIFHLLLVFRCQFYYSFILVVFFLLFFSILHSFACLARSGVKSVLSDLVCSCSFVRLLILFNRLIKNFSAFFLVYAVVLVAFAVHSPSSRWFYFKKAINAFYARFNKFLKCFCCYWLAFYNQQQELEHQHQGLLVCCKKSRRLNTFMVN